MEYIVNQDLIGLRTYIDTLKSGERKKVLDVISSKKNVRKLLVQLIIPPYDILEYLFSIYTFEKLINDEYTLVDVLVLLLISENITDKKLHRIVLSRQPKRIYNHRDTRYLDFKVACAYAEKFLSCTTRNDNFVDIQLSNQQDKHYLRQNA